MKKLLITVVLASTMAWHAHYTRPQQAEVVAHFQGGGMDGRAYKTTVVLTGMGRHIEVPGWHGELNDTIEVRLSVLGQASAD